MKKRTVQIGEFFMGFQSYYALVVALLWIFNTKVMFVSDYAGYTGVTLVEALANNFKPAELWLVTKRWIGVLLLPLSILMIFVSQVSYKRGERWSWFAMLVTGSLTWGGLIGYKLAIGYFELSASSMTFILGGILWAIAILLPAKDMLTRSDQ